MRYQLIGKNQCCVARRIAVGKEEVEYKSRVNNGAKDGID